MRRRWLERPFPNLRRRFKANRKEVVDGIEWLPIEGLDVGGSPTAMIAAVVVVALILFVVLPLLGIALELIGVLFVLLAGLFGRLLLGRPWIVEAVNLDDPEDRAAFAVQGWRQSSEALRELRTVIAATGPPDRIAAEEKLATRF